MDDARTAYTDFQECMDSACAEGTVADEAELITCKEILMMQKEALRLLKLNTEDEHHDRFIDAEVEIKRMNPDSLVN